MKEYISLEIQIITFENYAEEVLAISDFGSGFGDDDFGGEWDQFLTNKN